jgi:hypothetical protein
LVARYGFQASEQGIEEMEMELEFLEEDGDVYVTCIDCIDCIDCTGPLDGPIWLLYPISWDIGLAWAKLQDGNELFLEFQKCLKNHIKDIL